MDHSAPESDRQIVIVCSNTTYDENPLGAKPLALSLSKTCDVIYVDPPLSYVTALKRPELRSSLRSKRYKKIGDHLFRLTPVVLPGKDRPIIYKMTSLILKRKLGNLVKKISNDSNKKPILIATAPHLRVFRKDTFNIYWMMDDYASQPELVGINKKILEAGQKYLSENSDAVVTVSQFLHDTLKESGIKSTIINNGADAKNFRFPNLKDSLLDNNLIAKLPKTDFALYVGGISRRVDIKYFQALSSANVQLVIAGGIDPKLNRTEFDSLCKDQNVVYLGNIPNDSIPALMNMAAVGLVPYANEPFNEASMPLKIPEYLLCGLVVVSSDLDFTNSFESDDVYGESNPEKFVARVQELLIDPAKPSQRAMRSARIAKNWSWDQKAEEFLNLII